MGVSHYGLMKLGRCYERDYSQQKGCKSDVTSVMDKYCSGKTTCKVTLPDKQIYSLNVCPKELSSYLETSYFCVEGNLKVLYTI